MKLFGKKQANGGKEDVKKKPQKIKRKYKKPSDVKWFYFMPVLLVIGLVFVVSGGFIVHHNSAEYTKKILASSMAKGEELFLRNGKSDGTLTLGNTLLSADGKTLAVEVRYDEEAHKQLSSFGENYNLFLVDTEKNVMDDAELSYGMFGTDGSGVLTIHREKGFENKAFMVFILDKGVLVTTEDLQTDRTMSDSEINKSLSAQLAEIDEKNNDNDENTMDDEKLPPTYIIRLNAQSAEKSYRNWKNDKQLVEDLFVDGNLKKIESKKEDIEKQIKAGEQTLGEMDKRLEENPDDEIALSAKQDIENSIDKLEDELERAEDNFNKITETKIDNDVLSPKQKEFERFTVIDINRVK